MNIERAENIIKVYDRRVPIWVLCSYHNAMATLLAEAKMPVPKEVRRIALKGTVKSRIADRDCLILDKAYSAIPSNPDAQVDAIEPFKVDDVNVLEDFGMYWTLNKLASLTGFLCGIDSLRDGVTAANAGSDHIISYRNEFLNIPMVGIITRALVSFDTGGMLNFKDPNGTNVNVRVRLDEGSSLPPMQLSDPSKALVEARLMEIDARIKALSGGKDDSYIESERTAIHQTLSEIDELAEAKRNLDAVANRLGVTAQIVDPRTVKLHPMDDFGATLAVVVKGKINMDRVISRSSGIDVLKSKDYFGSRPVAEYRLPDDVIGSIYIDDAVFYFGDRTALRPVTGLTRPLTKLRLVRSLAGGRHPHRGSSSYHLENKSLGDLCQGDWTKTTITQVHEYIEGLTRGYLDSMYGNDASVEARALFEAAVRKARS